MTVEKNEHLNWRKFLEDFFENQISISFKDEACIQFSFVVENIFFTGIKITDKWGFITLEFNDSFTKLSFLENAQIKYTTITEDDKKLTWVTHSSEYSFHDLPCRVFPESGPKTIAFYDLKLNEDSITKLNNRIKVVETILIALIRFKIQMIKSEK
jgi:hypothetical protein